MKPTIITMKKATTTIKQIVTKQNWNSNTKNYSSNEKVATRKVIK